MNNNQSPPEIQHVPVSAEVRQSTKTKKRKSDEDPELCELRHNAKNHCKNIKEYRLVSKYNKAKLEEYLSDRTFMQSAVMCQQFSDVTVNAYGFLLDKLTKGNGFVESEIKSDISLKVAMSREMIFFMQVITNRIQILILTTLNVFNAKKKQAQYDVRNSGYQHYQPSNIEIFPENSDEGVNTRSDSNECEPKRFEEFAEEDILGIDQ